MERRKLNPLLACLVVTALIWTGCGERTGGAGGGRQPAPTKEKLKVIVIFDQAGLGDQGFNDSAWAGITQAQRELAIAPYSLQSREEADYLADLVASAENADVVVSVGVLFADEVSQAAEKHPGTKFIHIEGAVDKPNVAVFNFRSEHGGYLAGIVAGMKTRSDKVGVVAGMDIPPVRAYVTGFRAGVMTADLIRKAGAETRSATEVMVVTANSFDDPVRGKSLATSLISKGADVLFRVAGNTGQGVYQAVKETPGVLLIWEDVDRSDAIPGRVIACTLKRVDRAVLGALRAASQGRFKAGAFTLGLAEGGMDLTGPFMKSDAEVDRELARIVDYFRSVVGVGRLEIPSEESGLAGFNPAELVKEVVGK